MTASRKRGIVQLNRKYKITIFVATRMKQWLQSISDRFTGELSLRRLIFWTFTIPFVVITALMMLVAEQAATRAAYSGAHERFGLVAARTADTLSHLEEPARAWLSSMVGNEAQGLQANGRFALSRVHMDLLSRHDHITSLYFGYPTGEFARVMALRDDATRRAVGAPAAAAFAEQIISRTADEPIEEWRFHDAQQKFLTNSIRRNQFDPRVRPWYEGALKQRPGDVVGASPYVFAMPKVFGVSLATRLGGGLGAVGGVDFTVTSLSGSMQAQSASGSQQAVLFDAEGRVWAWSNLEQLKTLLQAPKMPTLADLPHAALRNAKALGLQLESAAPVRADGAEGEPSLLARVLPVEKYAISGLRVAVFESHDTVMGPARHLAWQMAAVALVALILGVFVIRRLARRIAAPLQQVSSQVKQLQRFEFRDIQRVPTRVREIRHLQDTVSLARAALLGYAKFVPRPLVQHFLAVRREPKQTVESRELVVMYALFSNPLHVGKRNNELAFRQLDVMTTSVQTTRGLVDHYENRGMSAIWNAPLVQSNPALRACEAAQSALQWLARDGLLGAGIHFGIDMGECAVGNFGSDQRLIYTAVGGAEEGARVIATNGAANMVIVTQRVKEQVQEQFDLEPAGTLEVWDGSKTPMWRIAQRKAGAEELSWAGMDSGPSSDPTPSPPSTAPATAP